MRPLVLLHGLGTGPSGWQPQVDAFPNAVAPRLDDAEETLEGAAAPFDLCGLSLGALMALRYAGDHPERVRRLVVCAGIARLPWYLRGLQYGIAGIVRVLPSGRVRTGLVSGLPEEHRAPALDEIAHVDARAASRTLRTAARFELGQLPSMPALVLCGDRDRVNVKLSQRLARTLPTARFELVPAAGHVANLDNPEAFNRLLRDFLAN